MGHSKICQDDTTYFNTANGRCGPCPRPPSGREINPNCGYDDYGGRHEVKFVECRGNKFNDGTHYKCQPCSLCALGFTVVQPCSKEADTKCQATQAFTQNTTASYKTNPGKIPVASWMVPLTFIICCATIALSCWFIYRKRGFKKSSCGQSTPLSATQGTNELKDILSPVILAAPLRCVLDDLDVLDELIMLLDPETKSIKNTKHLASLCSFSSNWVTYTYSLKETKSPLRALLEGVNCRHPDWTVEHLALLLQQIDRVDAVVALRNLSAGKLQTFEV
ncbi:hypothetical protein NQD34_012128 [Periophthalmus magnuspinnatus]|uniref:IGF-like family receptor 1 n=1 Tax=Periophthalmus magnuspinnatus TaxID=409849 RepID=UPI0022BECE00|nr:IGF-like family receptor 1 [Periophthalmus magnuspinnatus]KAJ0000286.1 hypothetical protein NQD34_012128 [Periophthalmus magnuspinnatus]